jgi:hypothetical protein
MRLHFGYLSVSLTSVCGAAIAALCFTIALAIPETTPAPAPGVAKPGASGEPVMSDTVNRAIKGDRLRIIVRPPDAEPFEVKGPADSSPKLLDGCESAFSQMDHASAKLARSCTT